MHDFHSLRLFFTAFLGDTEDIVDFVDIAALTDNFWLWIVALLFCMPLRHWAAAAAEKLLHKRQTAYDLVVFISRTVFSLAALGASISLLVGATNNAFIYTRF